MKKEEGKCEEDSDDPQVMFHAITPFFLQPFVLSLFYWIPFRSAIHSLLREEAYSKRRRENCTMWYCIGILQKLLTMPTE